MCIFNIHIDDNKASLLQTKFKDHESVEQWMQQQIDMLVKQQVALISAKAKKPTTRSYKHDALCGILLTSASYEELRDEYVSEKYGVLEYVQDRL